LIEAMAAGARIVASDLDAFRLVLRDGRAGELFPTGDSAALAAAAGRLLDDPFLRGRLSAAATDAVRAYDWPMVAKDVVKVYVAVVPAAGTAAAAPGPSPQHRTRSGPCDAPAAPQPRPRAARWAGR